MLFVASVVANAYDFEAVNNDGVTIYYNILSYLKKTCEVTYKDTDYDSYSGKVAIPEAETYNGTTYSVTSIGSQAFRGCSGLTSVTIPNSVETIGEYAFNGCTGLTQVIIPESVTEIGRYAFQNCTGLTKVNFNAIACSSVGSSSSYRAFYGCNNISTVNFGDNVTIIPEYLCCEMTGLTGKLTIPDSVTSIGREAFYQCSGLTEVAIGNSVTEIGRYAFYRCTGLTSVTIPNSVTEIGSSAFQNCSGLTSLTLGNSVTEIGSDAFYHCTGLTSVTIPNSVTEIGNSAFYGCTGLTEVTIGESVTLIGGSVFYNCTGLTQVNFNATACTSAGSTYPAFSNCSNLATFNFGDNVTIIPASLCYGLTGLTEVSIGKSMSTIGNYAFQSCSKLTQVTIPGSVLEMSWVAFYQCSGLRTVIFEDGEETLSIPSPSNAYYIVPAFDSFESLYLGRNMSYSNSSSKNEGYYSPFSQVTTLSSVTIGEKVKELPDYLFYNCTGLTEVTIGESVTEIGSYAFEGCTGLTQVTSLATTPPTITSSTFDETVVAVGVPIGALIDYANAKLWTNIPKIYAVSDGSEYYPVIISREGDAIVTASGGDENGVAMKSGATATITLIGSGQVNGLVQHGATDITETLNSKGSYSFVVSQYHKENVLYSYAFNASNTFDLTVSKAGDVLNQITVANINSVYSLKVSGDINGTDILTIRRMTNLQVLDLSDANVVSGGDKYYNNYSTSDDCVGDYFFYNMTSLRAVKLPNSVTRVGAYAFSGCAGLTSITIPSSVTSIANYAFKGCTGVVAITMEDGDEELAIGNDKNATPFSDCPFRTVYLGRTLNYDNDDYPTFKGKATLASLTVGNGATVINAYEFYGCTGLASLTISNGVTKIGDYAFRGCSKLASISLPSGLTTIGDYAFNGCTGLTSVSLSSGLTTIGDYAFNGCTGLTSVSLPSGLVTIGDYAFNGCTGLTKIVIPGDVESIGSEAFVGTNITTLTFNDGTATLQLATTSKATPFMGCPIRWLYLGRTLGHDYSPFKDMATIEGLEITSSVTKIESSAFSGCTGLTKVIIPNSVKEVGSSSFYGCMGITSLTIGNHVTSIGSSAFYNCTGLTEVKTPNSIHSIGSSAFYGCSAMTTLTIGNGCSSIGSSAFANCSKLRTVYSKAVTPPSISSDTFSSSTESDGTLYVPTGSLNPYWLHVYWVEFYNIVEMNFDDNDDTDPVGRVTTDAEAEIVGYYTTDGKPVPRPQRGINIIRYSDGTTRKVLVK